MLIYKKLNLIKNKKSNLNLCCGKAATNNTSLYTALQVATTVTEKPWKKARKHYNNTGTPGTLANWHTGTPAHLLYEKKGCTWKLLPPSGRRLY